MDLNRIKLLFTELNNYLINYNDSSIASSKKMVGNAVDILENEIGDRVQTLHNKYGFGYEVSFTNIEDNVRYSYE